MQTKPFALTLAARLRFRVDASGCRQSRPLPWSKSTRFFPPPPEFADAVWRLCLAARSSTDGTPVKTAFGLVSAARKSSLAGRNCLGPGRRCVERLGIEIVASERRENFVQHRVRSSRPARQMLDGYLLVPEGRGPFPAVVVPYYDPETSIGLKEPLRDFAVQLTRADS